MSEKLNLRIVEWTSWAMGRVLDWINYLDVDLKESNLEDWEDRDVQRHKLADEVAELEDKIVILTRIAEDKVALNEHCADSNPNSRP